MSAALKGKAVSVQLVIHVVLLLLNLVKSNEMGNTGGIVNTINETSP
jgi:hypothetical protein